MLRFTNILVAILLLVTTIKAEKIGIFYDKAVPQFEFAASDIKTALEKKGFVAELKPITELSASYANRKIVIALKSNAPVVALLVKQGGDKNKLDKLEEQAYALRTTNTKQKSYWAIGGDVAGAMYGGLQIAENIRFNSMNAAYSEEQDPYIKKRGIKFNIPLDERIPGFDSNKGDQAKKTIKDMWDITFWKQYLDDLARNRYNVLSYWTRHPFPVMIKLDDYPDVALNDVIDGFGKLVKKMTIDEKIAFWQEVMEYANNRCVDIYYITWNIFTDGVDGKYGITDESSNLKTKEYMRKCVKQFLLTYPHVSGIGVTAGEHMPKMTFDQREEWLWDTYAQGILDAKKEQPDREIRFIHRHWYSSCSDIMKHFKDYPDTFDFCFKYAKAHMFSSPNVTFEDFLLKEMPEGTKSWWNLRNDDIFYLRWGDPEFTRNFILGFDKDKTAGYLMGSDGYAWGRVYSSKDPAFNGQTENEKHWYNFMLWGRLGYNPNLSTDVFKNEIKHHFPEVSSDKLFEAWQTASKIIPQTTRFFWLDWDFQWYPEGCKGGKLITVKEFMAGNTMEGSGILNISDYCKKVINNEPIKEITPLDVAANLADYANRTFQLMNGLEASGNPEFVQTRNDILAFAWLGKYYSEKIKGATELAMYSFNSDSTYKIKAIKHLELALEHWKKYAEILSGQYLPQKFSRSGNMDWNELTKDVANDIELAKKLEIFEIEVSFENINDGDEYEKGKDLNVNVIVNSTFGIKGVNLNVNGESIGTDQKSPYQWDAGGFAVFKNMNVGSYTFKATVTDLNGNKAEKTIKILVK